MLNRIFKSIIAIIGALIGYLLIAGLRHWEIFKPSSESLGLVITIGASLLIGIIFYIFSNVIMEIIKGLVNKLEAELRSIPTRDIFFGSFGLIIGLIISYFVSQPLKELPIPVVGQAISMILTVVIYISLGYLGVRLAIRGKEELAVALQKNKDLIFEKEESDKKTFGLISPKVLDTSVIIDGRIIDIIRAGFIEGSLIIPNFVLLELQHIADSSDPVRREKGRRGLDILNEIQNQSMVEVKIESENYDKIKEVDSKLLELASDIGGKVITNDYNLNKVAAVRGIEVLNINELANAVKPVVVHGETMNIHILKAGKEHEQGLAYLDDGTMIVVEDGVKRIGETVDVVVTSILQTSAGKMIFTRLKENMDDR